MQNMLSIAPSPHVHGHYSTSRLMLDVVIALMPAFAVGLFFFGIEALILTGVSIVSCLAFEYVVTRFIMKQSPTLYDGSAIVTGLLLALNVPANLPWWIVVIGAFMAIVVAKMSFGGIGNNLFNPALFARAFMLVSFPVQMTTWPKPLSSWCLFTDAVTGATPLSMLKTAAKGTTTLQSLHLPDGLHMFLGDMGGSLGEISVLALLIGFAYLLIRKVITWHIPISIFLTVAIFAAILHFSAPTRYAGPLVELMTGGIMLGAIFMATDYVTSPMAKLGMIVYGVGIGALTIIIRSWGAYPEGVSFAILIMNAFVPLINRYIKPRKFGHAKPRK